MWSEQEANGRVTVTVSGEIDLYSAPQLERELEQDATEFVVDLLDCEFIDSTALGVLVAGRARVDRLTLIAPAVEVQRILRISGIDRVMPVYGSRMSLDDDADA